MTFAHPQWFFLLLILVPLLFFLQMRGLKKSSTAIAKLTATKLRPRLVSTSTKAKNGAFFLLELFAVSCLLVALARPQWGFTEEEKIVKGRNILIAIDTSYSMLSDDISPNRLEQTKFFVQDIIQLLPNERIGIITFSGNAFLEAPLTIDHQALIETVEQIDTNSIPKGGTNLKHVLTLALETFKDTSNNESNALLLLSDGEDHENSLEEIEDLLLNNNTMQTITIGVGTAQGSIIPHPEQGKDFVRDEQNNIVKSRLRSETLQKIALLSNGIYLNLNSGQNSQRIVVETLSKLKAFELDSKKTRIANEHFQIPLALAILCILAIYLMRTVRKKDLPVPSLSQNVFLFIIPLGILSPLQSQADSDSPYAAYQQKNYSSALKSYEKQLKEPLNSKNKEKALFGIGASFYQLNDYEKALAQFSSTLLSKNKKIQQASHYNLGNTLFRLGEKKLNNPSTDTPQLESIQKDWEDAINHYESSLDIDPNHKQSRENRDIVKKKLAALKEERKKQEQQKQNQQNKQESEQEKEEKKQKENQEPKNSKEQNKEEPNKEKDNDKEKEGSPQEKKQDKPGENPQQNDPKNAHSPQDSSSPEQSQEQPSQPQTPQKNRHKDTGYTQEELRALLKKMANENLDVNLHKQHAIHEQAKKNW